MADTAERMDVLRDEGHGPQRHHDPTDGQLQDRLGTPVRDSDGDVVLRPDGFVRSTDHIDPETGTILAVYRRDVNGDLHLRTMFARPRSFTPDSG
jgi:hypothetical protein